MDDAIPSLLPRNSGHQFVIYADACSGVPGALHERTFASVNDVVRRLHPAPEFILFPGDEIIGLTADADALRAQWRHWFEVEMSWFDRRAVPLWHTTGNHTTYDEMSEAVFREVLQLPRNGPPGQEGLSYWVRRDDLLIVFVHTLWSRLGGEGHVETDWLQAVLAQHKDARHKLVLGHHPVYAINGYSGSYQREIGHEYRERFWDILVRADVAAYLCSHILAFDVQVHRGVLQVCTAGAGTAHRMPEGVEYLHCVQAALDQDGFRYQVLDTEGVVREQLAWPLPSLDQAAWSPLPRGTSPAPLSGTLAPATVIALKLSGRTAAGTAAPQTLLCTPAPGVIAPLWLGLRGPNQTLTLILGRERGRSPYYWIGPDLGANSDFDLDIAFYPDMGPGGVLWRRSGDTRWTSCAAISATGLERFAWPAVWNVGCGEGGPDDRRYAGPRFEIAISVIAS
ncbi:MULTISPECIES: metallophosphoesterase family protein [Bradyrhizobium]|uniref:metallophosphoesterase family protein n=1 Tax=Bradyrhizobium brasilense TaxID=1419277 RepID=UPI0028777F8D|nr:metallophosphoesterase [Bradyrhizobium brasilense]MCP3414133.1 metallophosphoesterase [Bradyrhizobium brasilense]